MNATDALTFLAAYVPTTYPGADTALLCGSTVTGRATEKSDLDLVVLHPHLPNGAYRETVVSDGIIVEAFNHDLATLRYFLVKDEALPILAHMVAQGLPCPASLRPSWSEAKAIARRILSAGPTPLTEQALSQRRYTISNLADDLHSGLTPHARIAIGTELYANLADFALRASGQFSGRGKNLVYALERHDPTLVANSRPHSRPSSATAKCPACNPWSIACWRPMAAAWLPASSSAPRPIGAGTNNPGATAPVDTGFLPL